MTRMVRGAERDGIQSQSFLKFDIVCITFNFNLGCLGNVSFIALNAYTEWRDTKSSLQEVVAGN